MEKPWAGISGVHISGCGKVGNLPDLDSGERWFESSLPDAILNGSLFEMSSSADGLTSNMLTRVHGICFDYSNACSIARYQAAYEQMVSETKLDNDNNMVNGRR